MFKKIAIKMYNDELPKAQIEQIDKSLLEISSIPIRKGCNTIKKGFGEFGGIQNPIPVNGVRGEFIYINRLISKLDGEHYLFHRLCSYTSQISKTPVDLFELVSMTGRDWRQICFSPYYERRSRLAPSFTNFEPLAIEKKQKYYEIYWSWEKGYANGAYYKVNDFPRDLANVYRDTIFNVLELKEPYEPMTYIDGKAVFRCANQIHINQSHINELQERASSMATKIENTVSGMISSAMKTKQEYLNTQRDYYSRAFKESSLMIHRQAVAPVPVSG